MSFLNQGFKLGSLSCLVTSSFEIQRKRRISFSVIVALKQYSIYMYMDVFKLQAYCFAGDTLLEQDQCGKAIRALRESDKCSCLFLASC